MPANTEQTSLDQGDQLPGGLSRREKVTERSARRNIPAILVPIAVAPGCLGWGVPNRGGRPVEHP